jgi:hypothetical protein
VKIDPSWKPATFKSAIGKITFSGSATSSKVAVSTSLFNEFVATEKLRTSIKKTKIIDFRCFHIVSVG